MNNARHSIAILRELPVRDLTPDEARLLIYHSHPEPPSAMRRKAYLARATQLPDGTCAYFHGEELQEVLRWMEQEGKDASGSALPSAREWARSEVERTRQERRARGAVPVVTPQPYRAWINQPSVSQPDHELHGVNVIAMPARPGESFQYVYFLSGPVESIRIASSSLSPGWRDDKVAQ